MIGDLGKYFIKKLINDPVDNFFVYLFVIDNNVNSGTFGVFKIDFITSAPIYVYTTLTMSSGQFFSVNTIVRISQTDPNDFFFAGKARSFTDGTTTKSFPSAYGYIMKAKTTD